MLKTFSESSCFDIFCWVLMSELPAQINKAANCGIWNNNGLLLAGWCLLIQSQQ